MRRKKPPKPQLQWYALKVRAGKAKAVKRVIEREAKARFLTDYVGRCLIPRKRQLVLKKSARGERRVEESRMRFGRGYLFVHVALKKIEVWRLLNNCEFSLGLMPDRYGPVPVPDEQIDRLKAEQKADKQVKVRTGLKPGDEVEALEGMFEGMTGLVTLVQGERTPNPRIHVTHAILGRPVNQEYRHYQISIVKGNK